MRLDLLSLVCWLPILGALGTFGGNAMPAAEQRLTILFTGDRHGHIEAWRGWEEPLAGKTVGGMDRLATAVKNVREEVGPENVLLLDSGDAIGDTFIASETKGKAIVELMNLAGYDAMTIGNHEPDFTPQELRLRIAEARFPVIAANILNEDGTHFTKPYILRDAGGLRVGILGLAYPNTPLTTAKKNVEGLRFTDPVEAAKRMLPKIRAEGAQVLIVLAHGGLGAEKRWAEALEDADVLVGGHSHNRTEPSLQVGKTILVQAGAHGADLGRLDLEVRGGNVISHRASLIVLDNARIPADQAMATKVAEILAPYAAKQNEVIAQAVEPIIRAQTIAGREPRKRSHESPADSLFADILRAETKSEIALLPGVGYGVAIPKGPVTSGMLRNLIPHDSKVVTLYLTGRQIRDILEQSLVNSFSGDPRQKVGGMIQVSGLRFAFRESSPPGQRLTSVLVGDDPLKPGRKYRVATNSMLAGGGHAYKWFLEGEDRQDHEEQFQTIRKSFVERGQVRPPAPGRIRSE